LKNIFLWNFFLFMKLFFLSSTKSIIKRQPLTSTYFKGSHSSTYNVMLQWFWSQPFLEKILEMLSFSVKAFSKIQKNIQCLYCKEKKPVWNRSNFWNFQQQEISKFLSGLSNTIVRLSVFLFFCLVFVSVKVCVKITRLLNNLDIYI
jgi:hypothetical protein